MKSHSLIAILAVLTLALTISTFEPAVRANAGAGGGVIREAQTQVVQPGPAPVDFKRAAMYFSGGYAATSVAAVDVDGDGIPDLITTGASCFECVASQVGVQKGNGDGTFQAAVSYAAGFEAMGIAVADVNGDGHPDIVTANVCSTAPEPNCATGGGVTVLLGNGDGTFQSAVTYGTGAFGSAAVAVADVNKDGKPDLVVADYCLDVSNCSIDGAVSVLLGNGDGTFRAAVVQDSTGIYALSVAVADVNGDGNPDVLVTNAGRCASCSTGGVTVFPGKGDGTFGTPVSYDTAAWETEGVAVGDIDGDGHPDIVVASECPTSATCDQDGVVGVMLNRGDGTFNAALNYRSGAGGAGSPLIQDLNGDGRPEIVVAANKRKGAVGVLVNMGGGAFLPAAVYSSGGYGLLAMATADLDRDGRYDLLAANACTGGSCSAHASLGTVGVLLNDFVARSGTAVLSAPNPSQVGQTVTFTATVESPSAVPDGSVVVFSAGTVSLGTGTTTKGVATLTASFASAKTYVVKAQYAGDAYHKASSGKVKQVVTN